MSISKRRVIFSWRTTKQGFFMTQPIKGYGTTVIICYELSELRSHAVGILDNSRYETPSHSFWECKYGISYHQHLSNTYLSWPPIKHVSFWTGLGSNLHNLWSTVRIWLITKAPASFSWTTFPPPPPIINCKSYCKQYLGLMSLFDQANVLLYAFY